MTTGERFLQIKCGVNTRMPLEDRLEPIQGTSTRALKEAPAPRSAFLQRRHPVETTYNASLRSAVRSAGDIPPRGRPFDGFPVDGAHPPPLPPSTHHEEFAAGVASSLTPEGLGYYSRVRREEQADLNRLRDTTSMLTRNTKRSATQHTIEVLRQRELNPSLHPPPLDFTAYNRSRAAQFAPTLSSTSSTTGSGTTTSSCTQTSVDSTTMLAQLDRVRNFPRGSSTTYQTEFLKPHALIPSEIPDAFATQRSVLSDYASGGDMFLGTAKSLPSVALPFYMGHVPQHERNRSKILGDNDILRQHSKCTVNLASSKGVSSQSTIRGDRSDAFIAATMMGFYTLQAARATAEEKAVNRRV